jgi:uncharacterized protein (TIGR02453 family)
MPSGPWFDASTFRFLQDLTVNDDREWFQANKARHDEQLKGPALRFFCEFAPRLAKLSPHVRADPRPVGGSLFRIHRDTRFGSDKTPCKTQRGAHFRHETARNAHAPGVYLHLEPGGSFAAVGTWRPEGEALKAIRQGLLDEPAAWKRARDAKSFRARFGLAGDSLKRAHRGFDPEHALIDDLRRKDFTAVSDLKKSEATAADFDARLQAAWKTSLPFVRFLCEAVDQPV